MAKKTLFVLALALFLSGCASLPESLKTEDQNLVTDYQTWINAPQESLTTVRLGGVIAKVDNEAERTRIEVVNLPIENNGKPDINVEPEGRFVAYIDGFVDPVTYSKGRLVSILGNSDGYELGKVGEYEYRFPVMKASGYHLWQIKEKVIVHDQPINTFPCRSLYCREVRIGPTTGQVIQQVE
ncbi:starvation lipoprotein slp paralog [Vibrio ishigakensis]|uniref:Starvation lipoprotein slp paralog n=1 Tax=Vibrio ishigakensis TaxID=1481914 RepID=A0A0B8NY14_9VIBR|nr:Slp family lipoprotein [Vibrio ishigakensis]GAM55614.1 starvation lipoprotein slp paralog [Vibrio ishigakensis]